MSTPVTKRCITAASSQYKLAAAVSLGGMLEMYDFIIYGLMAGYIAEHFFPAKDAVSSLLYTFATFAAGYFARPIGDLVFGHLGDRYGRKKTFSLSIAIMAATTLLMGCLPSYQDCGLMAPLLMILLRLLQGFSVGGEIPGAITYFSESAPERQGLVTGVLFMSLMLGIALGTLVHALLSLQLGDEGMMAWGWRIPFWLGGSLGIISYLIRRHFNESGLFLALDQVRQRSSIPVSVLIQKHTPGLVSSTLIAAILTASASIYGIYMPSYLAVFQGFPASEVAWHTALAFLMLAPLCMLAGIIADLVNHKVLLTLVILAVAALSWPAFHYFTTEGARLRNILLICGLFTAGVSGLLPTMLINMFPTAIRFTGIAVAYNLGVSFFGGLAPLTSTWLSHHTDTTTGPAMYLTLVAVLSAGALVIPWQNSQETDPPPPP